jgi:oxygen-independent coproporphyrinogen-3 oxidase
LRLVEGFPVALFGERTGLPITAVERELGAAEKQGLIVRDHQWIRPTERGRRFLNDLLEPFLPSRGTTEVVRTISISPPDTARRP